MTRYRLDPVFDRTPDGAVIGITRYDIYLDGHFVGWRRWHALCHDFLDELMSLTPEFGPPYSDHSSTPPPQLLTLADDVIE